MDEHECNLRLDELFRRRFGDMPVAGDRIDLNGFKITVKELDNKAQIRQLGLKIPDWGIAILWVSQNRQGINQTDEKYKFGKNMNLGKSFI